jgi:SRSO17 transposase
LDEIAEVRPGLLDFTAEMLGRLARKDQRAAGELYVRGLLTDGQRKSMVPMAERLGVGHQRLQQSITSSTWDCAGVRANVAREYSGTLGKTANCQVAVSVHLAGEHASCAADWRLFCPESWDDQALDDPVAAAAARRRRQRAGIPDGVRHREKWRLALDMTDEMAGPGGWGVLDLVTGAGGPRPVVTADAGYGDNALFRRGLTAAGWQYAVAVKGGTSAYDGDAVPQARPYGGLGQPPKPACPHPPATLRQLALAHAAQVRPVTWRQGTRTSPGNPGAAMTSWFLAIRVRPASRHIPRAADRSFPACHLLAEWPPQAEEASGYWLSTLPEGTPSRSSCGWPRSGGASSTTTAS